MATAQAIDSPIESVFQDNYETKLSVQDLVELREEFVDELDF